MQEQDKTTIAPKAVTGTKDFLGSIMRGDKRIWSIYILLFCISAVEIFSATSQLTYKSAYVSDPAFSHIKMLFIGLIGVLLAQSMSLRQMRAWGLLVWFFAVCFAILTPIIGVEQKGAARSLGGIQPVELCKLGVVMALCTAITVRDATYRNLNIFRRQTQGRRYWFYLILIGLATLPIAFQNLSSGIIIGLASLGIMFLGRVNGKYLWLTLLVAGVFSLLFLGSLKAVHESNKNVKGLANITVVDSGSATKSGHTLDHWIDRASTWANRIYDSSDKPLWEEDVNGKKSQEIYSCMALVNGYPFGKFIGNSKLRDFLPEAFSDYIFAIIFEEWGPLGALLVMLLYLALLVRCVMLSRHSENPYIRLMMVGLPLIMVIQALMHIGVCTGAMFVTGQPLPLISRGGSSIVGTSLSFGLILALSRIIQQEEAERLAAAAPEATAESAAAQPAEVVIAVQPLNDDAQETTTIDNNYNV